MSNEYNDYQLLSPLKMEEVAKKYNDKIKSINHQQKEIIFEDDFFVSYFQLRHTLLVIKNYIYKWRKNDKRLLVIDNIFKILSNITKEINKDLLITKEDNQKYKIVNGYIQAILLCLNQAIILAKILCDLENNNTMLCIEIIEDLIKLI